MEQTTFYHAPVLPEQTVESLQIRPDGIYLDGTCGGGGHSSLIAAKLTTGRLIGLDQDPDAILAAGKRLASFNCVTLIQTNFAHMRQAVASIAPEGVDGILLDLGVSSHQLDDISRGFSYHGDAPLDMRMSQSGPTAADLVNTLSHEELTRILKEYGEEKFASRIASLICQQRETAPILTTTQLVQVIQKAIPLKAAKAEKKHPARRSFQALRIAVNRELEVLQEALAEGFALLRPGGRMSVLTFHSLEDRMVKQYFAGLCVGCTCPPEFPVCVCGNQPKGQLPFKKAQVATQEEIEQNPRSRTAKLRCIQKL